MCETPDELTRMCAADRIQWMARLHRVRLLRLPDQFGFARETASLAHVGDMDHFEINGSLVAERSPRFIEP
jgi:hypothetical protein